MRSSSALKGLIVLANTSAEKIFKHTGQLLPMWHAITTGGDHLILNQPHPNKNIAVELIRLEFKARDVDSYVFMSEAWMLINPVDPDFSEIARRGLSDHPDRREIIAFSAENRRGEAQTASRFILRPEHGKAKLSPLAMDEMAERTSEGRMVGLLSPERNPR